jgi:hypothetical protein
MFSRRISRPASLYVRLRVPGDIAYETDSATRLTMDILKFGITYEVDNRDTGYVQSHRDSGYMAFSFECDTRAEASAVERIVRAQFEDVAVFNSFEYLDVAGVAARLGLEYVANTYEDYVAVGRKLFVHMVETAKLVFPGKYLGQYGVEYDAAAKGSSRKLTGASKAISESLAMEYGFRTPSVTWTALSSEHREPVVTASAQPARAPKPPRHAWRELPFDDVPVFATMERGEAMYAAVAANMERASDTDKAGKVLHDYAMRKYQIDPKKIDERFYDSQVRSADAPNHFHRAKCFALAMKKTPDEIRAMMSRALEGITATPGVSIKVHRAKLKSHYTLLLKAQELIQGCIPSEQDAAKFSALQNVTITDATMCEQVSKMKDSMDASELKQLYKVLDLKDKATTFVFFRKMMAMAFGFGLERHNTGKLTKAWHFIDIKQDWLRDLKNSYSPAVLDAVAEYEQVQAPLKAPRFNNVRSPSQ